MKMNTLTCKMMFTGFMKKIEGISIRSHTTKVPKMNKLLLHNSLVTFYNYKVERKKKKDIK